MNIQQNNAPKPELGDEGAVAARLDGLRRRVRRLERQQTGREQPPAPLRFGIGPIDAVLPGGGLSATALHEIIVQGPRAAGMGFAAALLGRMAEARDGKAVLWCRSRQHDLYAPGLASFGLETGNLVVVRASTSKERLWAMEEGLRSGALAAVLGEIEDASPTALRRLQLAAETGRTAALLLRPDGVNLSATPAATRWRVSSQPSFAGPGAVSGITWPGAPCWRVELLKCRNGGTGAWTLEWHDGYARPLAGVFPGVSADAPSRGFAVAAPVRHRPPAAEPAGRQLELLAG